MNERRLTFITGYNSFFGQSRKPWVSLDASLIVQRLASHGIETLQLDFQDLANRAAPIDTPVFYTFSQKEPLRRFIRDTIEHAQRLGARVVPSLELLYCHENKGYQELYKTRHKLTDLRGMYVGGRAWLDRLDVAYPQVLKEIEGSNGKGVYLVHNREELDRTLRKITGELGAPQKLDLLRRRHLRKNKQFPGYQHFDAVLDAAQYKDYITPDTGFVLQEFIPNLSCDYRVIILYNRYYIVRRNTNEGDFRASGTKKFIFEKELRAPVLDYAREVYRKVGAPFLSLDIGVAGDRKVLFEFQALHFGINAIVRAEGYYRHGDDGWTFEKRDCRYEEEFADELAFWLEDNQLIPEREN